MNTAVIQIALRKDDGDSIPGRGDTGGRVTT